MKLYLAPDGFEPKHDGRECYIEFKRSMTSMMTLLVLPNKYHRLVPVSHPFSGKKNVFHLCCYST